MIHSADAMLDWYWRVCVQAAPVVSSDIVSCQVWVSDGEQAAAHCSDAVTMSPGFTVNPTGTLTAGYSSYQV